jgi:glucose-6-phosphate dehydrogenase assembly protein OpcA
MEGVWSAEDTTPGAIEAALRELLKEQHTKNPSFVPARVLNLVAIVDAEWRGEIENRLSRVGRYHPSRTVICAVERGRTRLDAWATMYTEGEPKPGGFALAHEHVVVAVGEGHLEHLDTIVDALVVTDLHTVIWAPHGHREAIDALRHMAQIVLLDSVDEPDVEEAVSRSRELAKEMYIVDLAWLRSTPWRERIAATFDPPKWRRELGTISGVTIRSQPDSAVSGVLLFGWLATRLGWRPDALMSMGGKLSGTVRAPRGEVKLVLEPHEQNVRGLSSVEITTHSGMSISLDRGTGGLQATRRDRKGSEQHWTVLGASRGEEGILGEGIRQALLRDPTYQPALDAACRMVA